MKKTRRSTFKLLFYVKKNAPKKDGSIPVMGRITIDGKKAHFSTKLSIKLDKWDLKFGRVSGRNKEANEVNKKLDLIRVRIHQCYNDTIAKNGFATAQKVKNAFLGINTQDDAILSFFEQYNKNVEKLVGITIVKMTYYRYSKTYDHLKQFILLEYHDIDIRFRDLKEDFIEKFELFLRTDIELSHNSISVYLYTFLQIVKSAVKKELIIKNPFIDYKISFKETDRAFLTKEEILQFNSVIPDNKNEELTQDLFIFSCFTGLAYIDVKTLKKENLQTFIDGSLWIIRRRTKTTTASNLRVLDIPLKIIEKYKDFSDELVFPMPSKPTCSKYLKIIQHKAGIQKHITFHVARHTFATFFLSENVPLESVSKMMGHKNLKTTLIYAKITNKKISRDLDKLEIQIKPMEEKMLSKFG